MENKQTAVEWLWRWIMDNPFGSFDDGVKAYNKAKAMEKNQIINAYVECWKSNMPDGYECKQSAEEYYNETYKNNEQ
jgi:HEPN domain-containing protein